MNRAKYIVLLLSVFFCAALTAFGQDAAAPKIDTGDTAWMLTSAALVLFMTIPGLFLFYGGLVRSKNVLGMLMQNFIMVGIITVQWIVIGYSLAFANGTSFLGGFQWAGWQASEPLRTPTMPRPFRIRRSCFISSCSPSSRRR
jgi:hypothetical protein